MDEYQLIAMGGIALVGVGVNIYFNLQKKKTLKRFNNWPNNYFIPKTEELQIKIDEFGKSINKLEKLTKKN
ncbi:MAG: hypothetical protein ABIE36_00845 [Candidatus Diapherotrites archaeon]